MTNEAAGHGEVLDEARRAAMRAAARRIDRVNEWLHVGGALQPEEYERFLEARITHVVDLREEDIPGVERLLELGVTRRQVPVPNGSPPTLEQLVEVAGWFESQDDSCSLYVHCGGGFGRAATMAIGLLILGGAGFESALEQVRQVRPEIILNEEQVAWLRSIEPPPRLDSSAR